MKNKLNQIKQTWTYNHKMTIVALALTVAHIVPFVPVPSLERETVTYYAPQQTQEPYTLEQAAEKRAYELYKENEAYDLEKYRHEALSELNAHLLDMIDNSPFVNYEQMARDNK